ncbi:MAG: alpha-glucuronidase family glycosyl hydrolase, partial [bacterium]
MIRSLLIACSLLLMAIRPAVADNGSELWLRYRLVADAALRAHYRAALAQIVVDGDSPTLYVARDELKAGLAGLFGAPVPVASSADRNGTVLIGTRSGSRVIAALPLTAELARLGKEAFIIRGVMIGGKKVLVVAANDDVGALYGAFALLRELQTQTPLAKLALTSAPR